MNWIKIKEQLPPTNKIVLVKHKKEDSKRHNYWFEFSIAYYTGSKFQQNIHALTLSEYKDGEPKWTEEDLFWDLDVCNNLEKVFRTHHNPDYHELIFKPEEWIGLDDLAWIKLTDQDPPENILIIIKNQEGLCTLTYRIDCPLDDRETENKPYFFIEEILYENTHHIQDIAIQPQQWAYIDPNTTKSPNHPMPYTTEYLATRTQNEKNEHTTHIKNTIKKWAETNNELEILARLQNAPDNIWLQIYQLEIWEAKQILNRNGY